MLGFLTGRRRRNRGAPVKSDRPTMPSTSWRIAAVACIGVGAFVAWLLFRNTSVVALRVIAGGIVGFLVGMYIVETVWERRLRARPIDRTHRSADDGERVTARPGKVAEPAVDVESMVWVDVSRSGDRDQLVAAQRPAAAARMIERERRFLVSAVPDPLPSATRIVQGYLTTEPVSVRVRRQDGRFTLTIKTGAGLARTEIERDLAADEFDALWAVAHDLRIEKRRHLVPAAGGHVAELDLLRRTLAGRRRSSRSSSTDDDAALRSSRPVGSAARSPTTAGYTNSSLARRGWPTTH